MTRDPESARFELDYWGAVLGELHELHELTLEAVTPLPSIPVALLEALLSPGGLGKSHVELIGSHVRRSMDAVARMQPRLDGLTGLVTGRLEALRRELELEETPGA